MEYVFVTVGSVTVFVLLYFVMKKVDAALTTDKIRPETEEKNNTVRILVENPFTAASVSGQLEKASQKYPDVAVYLYSGQIREVMRALRQEEADVGVLVSEDVLLPEEEFKVATVSNKVLSLYAEETGVKIEPYGSLPDYVRILWKDKAYTGDKAEFLKLLFRQFQGIV